MIERARDAFIRILRWSEQYTKTDMVYLAQAGWWLNLGVIATAALSFLLSIAYANLLPPATYGLYQYLLSISGLIATLALPGMNGAVAQAVARGYEGVMRKAVRAQLLWMPIPALISIGVALYYFAHGVTDIGIGLVAIAILTPLVNVFNTYAAFLEGKQDFKRGFYLGTIISVASYGSMFLAILFSKSAAVLIIVNLGVNLIATIYAYVKTLSTYKPNDKVDPKTIPYGKHLSVLGAVGILNQFDSILVFHFLGSVQLAVYSFATLLPERAGGLMNFIGTASLPRFANQPIEYIRKNILDKIGRLAFISAIAALAYAAIAPLLFRILFPRYISAIHYTQAFAAIIVFIAVTNIVNSLLYSKRFTREIYIVGFTQPILLIVLQVPLLIKFGIAGMIAAQLITSAVTIALSLWLFFHPLSPKSDLEDAAAIEPEKVQA
ncbi:MAG: oligosaccharide flippase family protein [Candidatus Pacebacteria bacterium]|nr:oligosaccharide flippase family protein [Candidatus Paceibacterota bacterium]